MQARTHACGGAADGVRRHKTSIDRAALRVTPGLLNVVYERFIFWQGRVRKRDRRCNNGSQVLYPARREEGRAGQQNRIKDPFKFEPSFRGWVCSVHHCGLAATGLKNGVCAVMTHSALREARVFSLCGYFAEVVKRIAPHLFVVRANRHRLGRTRQLGACPLFALPHLLQPQLSPA